MRHPILSALVISQAILLAACDDGDAQRQQLAQDHVRMLNKASEFFYIEHKQCPQSPNDLARLFTGTDDNSVDFSKDPWGNDFVMYKAKNGKVCLFKSLGADGEEGGDGPAADIMLEEAES